MACSKASSLAAALAVCGMCKPQPSNRRWELIDKVDSSRAAPGKVVSVRLGSAREKDSRGWNAHVRGFYIDCSANLNIPDATNDAVTAYQMRSIFRNFQLVDATGHPYFEPGTDGRVLLDDIFFRFWRHMPQPSVTGDDTAWGLQFGVQAKQRPTITDNGVATNAGASTPVRNVSIYYPLARPPGLEGSPFEGLIPLQLLKKKGAEAFKFEIATAFAGNPSDVAITSIENEANESGLNVWLDLVYLPGYVVDSPWQVSSYQENEKRFQLEHSDRTTEYAWLRYMPEDDAAFAGQVAVGGHDQITLSCGGHSEMSGMGTSEAVNRMALEESTMANGGWSHLNAALVLPTITSGGATALMLYGARRRDVAPAGQIDVLFGTRTLSFSRIAQRTVMCLNDDDRPQKIARLLDTDPCTVVPVDCMGQEVSDGKPRKNGAALVFPNNMTRGGGGRRVRAY